MRSHTHSLGFGIERLGLIALHRPGWTMAGLVAFTIFCIVGLFNLQPEGRLSEIYRGNSLNYQQYDRVSRLFPTSELDLLLLLSGKDLLDRDKIARLREVEDALAKDRDVSSALSMLSLRGQPKEDEDDAPLLFPKDLSQKSDKDYRKILKDIKKHPDVLGQMLSKPDENGAQTSLLILTLREDAVLGGNLYDVLERLKADAKAIADPAGLEVEIAGIPAIQQEIRNTISNDAIFFNLGGVLMGVLLSFYFIRKPLFIFMTSLASVMANIWVLGVLGHFGQALNSFMTVVPPLIMVITVSDGTHLVLDIYKKLRQGESKYDAVRHTLFAVGPACVLTSLTTTIALLSMTITDSAVIRSFGLTAAMGTIAAFVAIILVLPSLAMLLIRDESKYRQEKGAMDRHPLVRLEFFSQKLADFVAPRWRSLTLIGMMTGIVFAALYFQLQPRYNLSDEMPDEPALKNAINLIDDRLGGSNYIHVLVEYPRDKQATSPDVLEAIGEAHRLLGNLAEVNDVSSIEKTRLWFRSNGVEDIGRLKTYLDDMDPMTKRRFLNEEKHAALVSGKIISLTAADNRVLVDRIKAILANMQAEYPDMKFTVSGLSTLAALQSTSIISQLNNGLLLAILVVVGIIGFAFRSLEDALLSIAPNLFPIFAAGALLYVLDEGLQYASILGLTVAFGLAVDDTIHFLNRYHLERKATPKVREQVANSISHIGTVLVLTTLILICGLAVTAFSSLSMTRLFGYLSIATLTAALLADLFFLPALIIAVGHYKQALARLWYAARHPQSISYPANGEVPAPIEVKVKASAPASPKRKTALKKQAPATTDKGKSQSQNIGKDKADSKDNESGSASVIQLPRKRTKGKRTKAQRKAARAANANSKNSKRGKQGDLSEWALGTV